MLPPFHMRKCQRPLLSTTLLCCCLALLVLTDLSTEEETPPLLTDNEDSGEFPFGDRRTHTGDSTSTADHRPSTTTVLSRPVGGSRFRLARDRHNTGDSISTADRRPSTTKVLSQSVVGSRYRLARVGRKYDLSTTAVIRPNPTTERTIRNPHPFQWLILERDICQRRTDLFMVIVVHSAPPNLKRRILIRNTYGSRIYYSKVKTVVVFALGSSVDPTVQKSVRRESEQYHDIIQENFIDSYRNLTYKGVMWLRWTSEYCTNAKFVLKADDDIFVNVFNIAIHLATLRRAGEAKQKTILCLLWTGMRVMRDKKNKWYLSKKQYSKDYFAPYCSGSAYIITMDLMRPMYEASFNTTFFWVDDVYVTGMLLESAGVGNVTYTNIESLYVLKPDEIKERIVDGYAIFGHLSSLKGRRELWNSILISRGMVLPPKLASVDAVQLTRTFRPSWLTGILGRK